MKRFYVLGMAVLVLAGCAAPEPPRAERAAPALASSPGEAVWPVDGPAIQARSAILIDARTGRVLFQKYADTRTQVASTQKLVTALVLLGRGNLDGRLIIAPEDCAVEPAKLGVRAGQSYSRRSLLTAMMVKSENDAAAALARDHSGGTAAFAEAMNRKAWDLGARDSCFV